MTSDTTSDDAVPPVVCTLTSGQLDERGLEWTDLGALSLTNELIDGGVASTYPLSLADKIEDLANREISCCGSWLDIAWSRIDDTIRIELTTVNPDGLEMITSMAGLSST